jgi:glyoxylase-like metal-dependent hydrolase (beta-lactamase superfamily II)
MDNQKIVIRQMDLGPMMNFIYLIGCLDTRMAAVVDPAWDVPRILEVTRELDLNLSHILLTHLHPDHANGLEDLLQATNALVCIHGEEISYAQEMARRFQISVNFLQRRSENILSVTDEQEIRVGALPVRCLHTPGHTPGSMCYVADGSLLFSGDTIRLRAGEAVPFAPWLSRNRDAHIRSVHTLARIEGLAHIFTAHSGATADVARAFRRWREVAGAPGRGECAP